MREEVRQKPLLQVLSEKLLTCCYHVKRHGKEQRINTSRSREASRVWSQSVVSPDASKVRSPPTSTHPRHPWSSGKGKTMLVGMSRVCTTPYKYAPAPQGVPASPAQHPLQRVPARIRSDGGEHGTAERLQPHLRKWRDLDLQEKLCWKDPEDIRRYDLSCFTNSVII